MFLLNFANLTALDCFTNICSNELTYRPGRPGASHAPLRVFLCKSVLYGAFVLARRALKHRKRRSPARAVHRYGMVQNEEDCEDMTGSAKIMLLRIMLRL